MSGVTVNHKAGRRRSGRGEADRVDQALFQQGVMIPAAHADLGIAPELEASRIFRAASKTDLGQRRGSRS